MSKLSHKITRLVKKQLAMLLEPVIGYSRVVSFTKIMLLVVALVLTIALVVLPLTSPVNKNFRLTFLSVEKSGDGELSKMVNPHLQGVDSNDQTYNIIAKSAIQDKMERLILNSLTADINLKNNGWISITADDGLFDHSKNTIDLKGNINLYNHEGYEFSTSEAHADIKKNTVYGNTKVSGQGPLGNIVADSFSVEEKGKKIKLTGNVKLVIFPNSHKND